MDNLPPYAVTIAAVAVGLGPGLAISSRPPTKRNWLSSMRGWVCCARSARHHHLQNRGQLKK